MKILFYHIRGDKTIWAGIGLLAIFSFLPIYSASSNLVYVVGKGTTLGYLIKHLSLLFLGFVVILLVHRIPYNYFKALSIIMMPLIIVLLFYTLFQGITISGANASRWIRVPFVGLSFQTSNLASIVLLSYVVQYLYRKQKIVGVREHYFKHSLIYLWLPVFLVVGLIFPANFSTAFILLLMVFVICFIAGYPNRYLLRISLSGLLVGVLFILFVKVFPNTISNRVDTWASRIETFFGASEKKDYYQVEKAKIAIATGGITGLGAGKSVMKNFLPQSSSDFIYAIILEEFGLIGGLGLLFCYLFLFFRMMVIVNKIKELYGKLLLIVLSFYIATQTFIHMAVAVDLMPVTGQNLPLVSNGGTSIWTTCMTLGMILSVSSNNSKDMPQTNNEEDQESINPLDILSAQV